MKFLETKSPDQGKSSFKVTMGVMPDYTFEGTGLRIDGVTDGKPASKGGILKGDIIISLGEDKIATINDYMKALGKHQKGDIVPVTVTRSGKEIKLSVTF